MKCGRPILLGVLALITAVALWRFRESQSEADSQAPAEPRSTESFSRSGDTEIATSSKGEVALPPDGDSSTPAFSPAPAPAPLAAPNPPSARRQTPAAPPLPANQRPAPAVPEPAQAAVEALALNLREYRDRFGGNPVGNNAEIVREMDGGNAKGAAFLPAGVKRLNGQGELIDEWGVPYFFHQESADQMEVRSAGADRVMWTSDDLVGR